MVLIYLDTSDFSLLTDAAAGRPAAANFLPVLEALEGGIEKGQVTVAYSFTTLSELLQYRGGGRELTLRKAAMVERLCGSNAFRHSFSIPALELAVLRKKIPEAGILSRENEWYPETAPTDLYRLRSEAERKAMQSGIERGRNRAERKKIEARLLPLFKAGKMWEVLDLESVAQEFAADPKYRHYPVGDPELFGRVAIQALRGEISNKEFDQKVFGHVASPTRFVEYYFEIWGSDHSFSDFIREAGLHLVEGIEESRKILADLPEGGWALLPEKAGEFGTMHSRRLFRAGSGALEGVSENEIDTIPAVQITRAIITQYMIDALSPGGRKEMKASDLGDMLHALYLPHCDLWRGDSYFATLAQKALPGYAKKIVTKLRDLPDRIQALLATKA